MSLPWSVLLEMQGRQTIRQPKPGMIGLTKSLASEFSARSVTVNAIAPGFIDTDMTSELDERVKEGALAPFPLKDLAKCQTLPKWPLFYVLTKHPMSPDKFLRLTAGW
jgi:3-oxoacyl-[acyl-carrier protein] reductase